jgi:hypothetical protein
MNICHPVFYETAHLPQPHNNWILFQVILFPSGNFYGVDTQHLLDIGCMDGDLRIWKKSCQTTTLYRRRKFYWY